MADWGVTLLLCVRLKKILANLDLYCVSTAVLSLRTVRACVWFLSFHPVLSFIYCMSCTCFHGSCVCIVSVTLLVPWFCHVILCICVHVCVQMRSCQALDAYVDVLMEVLLSINLASRSCTTANWSDTLKILWTLPCSSSDIYHMVWRKKLDFHYDISHNAKGYQGIIWGLVSGHKQQNLSLL